MASDEVGDPSIIGSPSISISISTTMTTATAKRRRRRKRICLFGLSGDPPTGEGGHVGVVRALWRSNRFDEIRILPVYRHSFASKRDRLVSFEDRVKMCRLAFEGIESEEEEEEEEEDGHNNNNKTKIIVSESERDCFQKMAKSLQQKEEMDDKSPPPNDDDDDEDDKDNDVDESNSIERKLRSLRVGTADLLEMLMEEEEEKEEDEEECPEKDAGVGAEFSFCLGGDTFMDLTDWKWRRSRDVMELLEGRFVVIFRRGVTNATEDILRRRVHGINAMKKKAEKVYGEEEEGKEKEDDPTDTAAAAAAELLVIPTLEDVSSTQIRAASTRDELEGKVAPKVIDYIIVNRMYGFAPSSSPPPTTTTSQASQN